MKISRVFQEGFKGVSRKIGGFLVGFKGLERCSKVISGKFQICIEGVSRNFEW